MLEHQERVEGEQYPRTGSGYSEGPVHGHCNQAEPHYHHLLEQEVARPCVDETLHQGVLLDPAIGDVIEREAGIEQVEAEDESEQNQIGGVVEIDVDISALAGTSAA